MTEIWKAVPGYEDRYEVSSEGRVRSLVRGHILRGGPHKGGYVLLHLYGRGPRKVTTLHAVVAEAFLGPRKPGEIICHGDGDSRNNRVENLRYGTYKDNADDTLRHGRRSLGEGATYVKLTEKAVSEIRKRRGEPQADLAKEYGVTFSNISAIQLRKSWRHV